MLKQTLLALLLFCSISVDAQPPAEYQKWTDKANAFYEAKEYRKSGEAFTKAFETNGWKASTDDRYNAACSWAMAGVPDSAFYMLMRLATKAKYANLSHLLVDTDLESLHRDKRWDELCAIVKQNKNKEEEHLNKPLVAMLDSIYQDDQGYRIKEEEVATKYGRDSKEYRNIWKVIEIKDSVNLTKIIWILDKYGWLGADEVGRNGSETIFLVIQHSDQKTQEKYLPMMQEAVKNNKARPASLALLEDRVALGQGKKQKYGSQIGINKDGSYYVQDLEDPDNVDKRRAEVGLEPLVEYVRHWDLKWDPAAYKKTNKGK